MTKDHPLFQELRSGLWHCTSPRAYRQILTDRFIKPSDGILNKEFRPSACQELGGVSLFDFETHSADDILEAISFFKWGGFIIRAKPVTVIIGMQRSALKGRLVPYPENKCGTTGVVIPLVEVCHCGPIPLAAASRFLLVCPTDTTRFHRVDGALTEDRLADAETEFKPRVTRQEKEWKAADAKWRRDIMRGITEELRASRKRRNS